MSHKIEELTDEEVLKLTSDLDKSTESGKVESSQEQESVDTLHNSTETDTQPESEEDGNVEDTTTTTTPEEFYQKVTGKLKANGQEYSFKNPEEIISLMQKGLDYTKKTQELSKKRKILTTLEKHDISDDDISLLVDFKKGDKKALASYLKKNDIDPFEIDLDEADQYKQGVNIISDHEANFHEHLSQIASQDKGSETIAAIQQWDDSSKKTIWENPELLGVFHEQQRNGVYAKICKEMERQKLVGGIPDSLPFIEAYKLVGNKLLENVTNKPKVIDERSSFKKDMNSKAKSAGAMFRRTVPSKLTVNDLGRMSDEEFLKQF